MTMKIATQGVAAAQKYVRTCVVRVVCQASDEATQVCVPPVASNIVVIRMKVLARPCDILVKDANLNEAGVRQAGPMVHQLRANSRSSKRDGRSRCPSPDRRPTDRSPGAAAAVARRRSSKWDCSDSSPSPDREGNPADSRGNVWALLDMGGDSDGRR